jgi:lipoyl(octanoyl) transferase
MSPPSDRRKDQAKHLFAALNVYRDISSRTAAMNMAIDETLLEQSKEPSIRFYRWNHPAVSFGYFGKYLDIEIFTDHRDTVRRWTGGGIVFHGDDLTYSVIIPAPDPTFAESSMSIYEAIHQAVQKALAITGQNAELVAVAAVHDRRNQTGSIVAGRRYSNDACFSNPVRADVLVNGRKIAGAAQRRTRLGLLQQGSIQHVDLAKDFEIRLARELSLTCDEATINDVALHRAQEISDRKYSSEAWLHKR